jgi:hypothetical protein
MLTGDSWFHISTPLGIEPGSLMTGSKQVDYWTSGTMYKCSEIAGSPQTILLKVLSPKYKKLGLSKGKILT